MGVYAYDRGIPGCLVGFLNVKKTTNWKLFNKKNVKVLKLLKHSGILYEKARNDVLCGSTFVKVICNSL